MTPKLIIGWAMTGAGVCLCLYAGRDHFRSFIEWIERKTMPAPRRSKDQIERDWYGCFARWNKQDRAAALKVLSVLHEQLPENPRSVNGHAEEQLTLPAEEPLRLKETE